MPPIHERWREAPNFFLLRKSLIKFFAKNWRGRYLLIKWIGMFRRMWKRVTFKFLMHSVSEKRKIKYSEHTLGFVSNTLSCPCGGVYLVRIFFEGESLGRKPGLKIIGELLNSVFSPISQKNFRLHWPKIYRNHWGSAYAPRPRNKYALFPLAFDEKKKKKTWG